MQPLHPASFIARAAYEEIWPCLLQCMHMGGSQIMMVLTVITCLYSCERNKSRSYCVTGFSTAYIAYAETEETKTFCWLYYKPRILHSSSLPPSEKTAIRMKKNTPSAWLKRLYCLSISFSDMYSTFQTYQTWRWKPFHYSTLWALQAGLSCPITPDKYL